MADYAAAIPDPSAAASVTKDAITAQLALPGAEPSNPERGMNPAGTWIRFQVAWCDATGRIVPGFTPIPLSGFDPTLDPATIGPVYQHRLINAAGVVRTTTTENTCDPASPGPPTPLPTADDLMAAASRLMSRSEATTSPHIRGLVGLENWFWYGGPDQVQDTVSLGGWTATATARPVYFEWALGTGDSVGADHAGSEASPAQSHIYSRQGNYDLALTVTWEADFTVSGYGITIPSVLGSVDIEGPVRLYGVIEIEAVNS
jgi:hypothetical protein